MYLKTDSLGHHEILDDENMGHGRSQTGIKASKLRRLAHPELYPTVVGTSDDNTPNWWNYDGKPTNSDQILHEIRDQFGSYILTKKLRYDTYQAVLKAKDPLVRQELMNLMLLVDNPSPTKNELQQLGKMYKGLRRDPIFNQQMQSMMNLISYG
jgi:hypothetical protein